LAFLNEAGEIPSAIENSYLTLFYLLYYFTWGSGGLLFNNDLNAIADNNDLLICCKSILIV
jgi:hypothetical protein